VFFIRPSRRPLLIAERLIKVAVWLQRAVAEPE
jgi:hypothetical protein